MSLGSTIYSLLSTLSVGTRVYPGVAPAASLLPRIVYSGISAVAINSLGGFTSQLQRQRLQVDCYAKTYVAAQALADEVCGVLDARNTRVFNSLRLDRRDFYEDELALHRVSIDFSVWERTE